MGDPGTKAPLSLEELQAAANLRTGRKHVLSLVVQNRPGVLVRIAGLFARRGYNIETLAVGPTDNHERSRVTITIDGASHSIDQVTKQLHKLVNVLKIRDLEPKRPSPANSRSSKSASRTAPAAPRCSRSATSSGARSSTSPSAPSSSRSPAPREDQLPRGHAPAVRPHRDDAHRGDRHLPRPRRNLSILSLASSPPLLGVWPRGLSPLATAANLRRDRTLRNLRDAEAPDRGRDRSRRVRPYAR